MDNAIDALKMAFAVLVLVIAISISMRVFSQAKTVSDEVFYMTDKTNFYDYTGDIDVKEGRIVSGESIIPTLYRYYKEQFVVIIKDDKGETLWEFNLAKEISEFGNNSTFSSITWVGDANIDTKTRVDAEVSGKPRIINDKTYTPKTHDKMGIYEYVKGKKFLESLKEIKYSVKEITIDEKGTIKEVGEGKDQIANPTNETLEIVKGSTKVEITYQLIK